MNKTFLKSIFLIVAFSACFWLIRKANFRPSEAAPQAPTTAQPEIPTSASVDGTPEQSSQHLKNRSGSAGSSQTSARDGDIDKLMADIERDDSDDKTESDLDLMLRELRIQKVTYDRIVRKHARLKIELARADKDGSKPMRRMLLNDYRAWVKEQLGERTYERFVSWTGSMFDLQS